MFKRLRRRTAGFFGRKEHFAGELLGVIAICHTAIEKNALAWIILIVWTIYYLSHKLEKKIYGKYGYR